MFDDIGFDEDLQRLCSQAMQWYIPPLTRLLGITSQTLIKHIKIDVATLDSKTSPICQEMDGKHFPMKDFKAGLTAPPFHCWCRSCTCPYFDDEFSQGGMRAARGEDGESYYVLDDMSYEEWKKTFVNGVIKIESEHNIGTKITLIVLKK